MKKWLFLAGTVLISACNAQAEDKLLASELIYGAQQDGWIRSVRIDPWMANRPALVRKIRSERIASMNTLEMECALGTDEQDPPCYEVAVFTLQHEGKRLINVLEETEVFSGGAHSHAVISDHLYDLQTDTRIRFGDLFLSWDKVRPVLQRVFCEQLAAMSDNTYECPDIQKQAIVLDSYPLTGKVTGFVVNTQDYALGSYADGRTSVLIDLTAQLLSSIKAEYRDGFKIDTLEGASADEAEIAPPPESTTDLAALDQRPRGHGSCNVGDEMDFLGGWVVGAAGRTVLDNPVGMMREVMEADEAALERGAKNYRLHFDWQGGCQGMGQIDARPVKLASSPETIEKVGGEFFSVISPGQDEEGRKRSCILIVQAKDVVCKKS